MKEYDVTIYITGKVFYRVEAGSEEEADNIAIKEFRIDESLGDLLGEFDLDIEDTEVGEV